MKKILSFAAVFVLLAATDASAGGRRAAAPRGEGIHVVTTFFPTFDFVRQIGGDRVQVTMLLSPGAESHSFEPTPMDIITIRNADLFIYLSAEEEAWVPGVLASVFAEAGRQSGAAGLLGMVDGITRLPAGAGVHGHIFQDELAAGHGHSHGHADEEDEHVWTNPRNVMLLAGALADLLSERDPANAYFFRANADAFIAELAELEAAFFEVVAGRARGEMVFADRFPFRHFAHYFGLDYYAALSGCSVETMADPAAIVAVINVVRARDVPAVFHRELSDLGIANVVAGETGARLLEFHSAHNLSPAEFAAGVTFLDIMRRNVEALRDALWQ